VFWQCDLCRDYLQISLSSWPVTDLQNSIPHLYQKSVQISPSCGLIYSGGELEHISLLLSSFFNVMHNILISVIAIVHIF